MDDANTHNRRRGRARTPAHVTHDRKPHVCITRTPRSKRRFCDVRVHPDDVVIKPHQVHQGYGEFRPHPDVVPPGYHAVCWRLFCEWHRKQERAKRS